MLSEEIWKKLKKEQKYITTNEDLSNHGYRFNAYTKMGEKQWGNIDHYFIYTQTYYETHKEKILLQKKIEYYNDIEKVRDCARSYRVDHLEEDSIRRKKKYWANHEENLQKGRQYRHGRKELVKKIWKKYYRQNSEKIKQKSREYRKTPNGKESQRRIQAERHRNLGYNEIAKFKHDSVIGPTAFHHLDDINVIEIPKWLHVACQYPEREIHRKYVLEKWKSFLTSEYYDILDQDIFDRYANGEN